MKRLFAISLLLSAMALAFSCDKAFVTSITLAVDYSDNLGGMVLQTNQADTCYIHVVSNTSWNASLTFDDEDKWATLGTISGSGQAWIPFYSTKNKTGNKRYATFRVETTGKEKSCEFTITQP